jgi:hypothetical protein
LAVNDGAANVGVRAVDAALYAPLPTAFVAKTLPVYEVPLVAAHVFERLVNSVFADVNVSAVDQLDPPFVEY